MLRCVYSSLSWFTANLTSRTVFFSEQTGVNNTKLIGINTKLKIAFANISLFDCTVVQIDVDLCEYLRYFPAQTRAMFFSLHVQKTVCAGNDSLLVSFQEKIDDCVIRKFYLLEVEWEIVMSRLICCHCECYTGFFCVHGIIYMYQCVSERPVTLLSVHWLEGSYEFAEKHFLTHIMYGRQK